MSQLPVRGKRAFACKICLRMQGNLAQVYNNGSLFSTDIILHAVERIYTVDPFVTQIRLRVRVEYDAF